MVARTLSLKGKIPLKKISLWNKNSASFRANNNDPSGDHNNNNNSTNLLRKKSGTTGLTSGHKNNKRPRTCKVNRNELEGKGIAFVTKEELQFGPLLGEGGFAQVFGLFNSSSVLNDNNTGAGIPSSSSDEENNEPSSSSQQDDQEQEQDESKQQQQQQNQQQPPQCGYAVKTIRKGLLEDKILFQKAADDLVNETEILAKLDHRCIIKMRGMSKNTDKPMFHPTKYANFFLLLDRLSETLSDRIQYWKDYKETLKPPTLETKIDYAYQLAQALQYLHTKRILFRDLKPENIGFRGTIPQNDHNIQLFDFGMARELPITTSSAGASSSAAPPLPPKRPPKAGEIYKQSSNLSNASSSVASSSSIINANATATTLDTSSGSNNSDNEGGDDHQAAVDEEEFFHLTICGTQRYMSQEVLLDGKYTFKSDCYTWAMVVWEIIAEAKPFHYMTPSVHKILVCKQGDRPPLTCYGLPLPLQDLLSTCWAHKVSDRITMTSVCEQLQKLLGLPPVVGHQQQNGGGCDSSPPRIVVPTTSSKSPLPTTRKNNINTNNHHRRTNSHGGFFPRTTKDLTNALQLAVGLGVGVGGEEEKPVPPSSIEVVQQQQQQQQQQQHPLKSPKLSQHHHRRTNSHGSFLNNNNSNAVPIVHLGGGELQAPPTPKRITVHHQVPNGNIGYSPNRQQNGHRRTNSHGGTLFFSAPNTPKTTNNQIPRQHDADEVTTLNPNNYNMGRSAPFRRTKSDDASLPPNNIIINNNNGLAAHDDLASQQEQQLDLSQPVIKAPLHRRTNSNNSRQGNNLIGRIPLVDLLPSSSSSAATSAATDDNKRASFVNSKPAPGKLFYRRMNSNNINSNNNGHSSLTNSIITRITRVPVDNNRQDQNNNNYINNGEDHNEFPNQNKKAATPSSPAGHRRNNSHSSFLSNNIISRITRIPRGGEDREQQPVPPVVATPKNVSTLSSSSSSPRSHRRCNSHGSFLSESTYNSRSGILSSDNSIGQPQHRQYQQESRQATSIRGGSGGGNNGPSLAELQERKRDLKEQLKQFDISFAQKHGRMPNKTEKEIIRPMYDHYNGLKSYITSLECLKNKLKQYDKSFAIRHGRMPTKAEKEILRHQYQKYKSLKAEIANFLTEYEQYGNNNNDDDDASVEYDDNDDEEDDSYYDDTYGGSMFCGYQNNSSISQAFVTIHSSFDSDMTPESIEVAEL